MINYAEFKFTEVGPQTWDVYLTDISPKVLNIQDFSDGEKFCNGKRFCRIHELTRWVHPKRGRPHKEIIYRVADPHEGEVETAFKSKEEAAHLTFYRRAQLRRGRPPIVRATPKVTAAGFGGAIAIKSRRMNG